MYIIKIGGIKLNLNINYQSLKLAVSIFKDLWEQRTVEEAKLEQYLDSLGIIFLKKHLKHYGGTDLNKKVLDYLIARALYNPAVEGGDNIIIRSFKKGYNVVNKIEIEFINTGLENLIVQASDLANQFLPGKWSGDIELYPLYGIRGTAIVLGKELAFDICDDVLMTDEGINLTALLQLLAHEIHHIAVEEYLEAHIRNISNVQEKKLYKFIGSLISEGAAVFYLTNPIEMNNFLTPQWKENLNKANELLSEVQTVMNKLRNDELYEVEDTQYLFDESLKGYTVGYLMVQSIHNVLGKNKVIDSISNPQLFIDYYNQAVVKTDLNLLTLK